MDQGASGGAGSPAVDPDGADAGRATPVTEPDGPAVPVVELSAPAAAVPIAPAPVEDSERLDSIDTVRGVALLGILVMNVVAFALPDAAYFNPPLAGGFAGIDFLAWIFSHLVFELKMMTLFSMLFGAGALLMMERLEARGGGARRIWFRRILALALIGAVHGYLIWWGDILFSYAQCGLFLWMFRKKSTRFLAVAGVLVLAVGILGGMAFAGHLREVRSSATALEAKVAAGTPAAELPEKDRDALEEWRKMRRDWSPTAEDLAAERKVYAGGWLGIAKRRAPKVFELHTVAFLGFLLWRATGAMLLGMALLRSGFLSARLSPALYVGVAAAGYAIGLPLVTLGARRLLAHDFDFVRSMASDGIFNYVGSLFVAAGHLGLVLAACRTGALPRLRARLAAVGRTALSNYLVHSLLLTTVFYGYGLGLFERLSRAELLGVVAVVWAVQLAFSEPWLRRFRFGPVEWLWRTMTYGRAQPMRRGPAAEAAG